MQIENVDRNGSSADFGELDRVFAEDYYLARKERTVYEFKRFGRIFFFDAK